jgi:hypothetical protein
MAQNAPSNPMSSQASNIVSADTHSQLAPQLPTPGQAGSPEQYLMRAKSAIRAGRTGEAQEALERAETRLLDRSTAMGTGNMPDDNPRVKMVQGALMALGRHDRQGAVQQIDMAMRPMGGGMNMGMGGGMSGGMSGGMMNNGMAGGMTPAPMVPAAGMAPGMTPGIGQGAPPNGGSAAANTRIYSSCGVPPCVEGTPPAAPGGGSGSGPAALRTSPLDSPVGTGAGGHPGGS